MLIVTPSGYRCAPITITPSPTSTSVALTTAGTPHPRAITAAWLASPPNEVSTPAARAMAGTSAGDVSTRTRMNGRPASPTASAAPSDVTISPVARPREAGSPLVTGVEAAGQAAPRPPGPGTGVARR